VTKTGAKIKRVLLKLSGEMLGGEEKNGLSTAALELIAGEIADLHGHGFEVGVVIGGGNIFRGSLADDFGMERSAADYMGMLATCINGLALQAVLENRFKINTRVLTAVHMPELAEPYIRRKAIKHLERKRVVIFAGGTGNPYFTTDTAASLRALEVDCDIILKATKVDGIYTQDPEKSPDAKKYHSLTYLEVIAQQLRVMDATAITMCMEANLPIKVFKLEQKGSVLKALLGDTIGTMVR
jgi:uridylate kinase